MTIKGKFYLTAAAICLAGVLVWSPASAQIKVPIKANDIGGVVTSLNGPEAGVWVIAETHDLPTRFARMVVTDDQGRYVVPDLPKAKYTVWVRGYGLVDSAKVEAQPGKQLDLTAVPAKSDAEAAKVIRRSIGIRCSRFLAPTSSAARATSRQSSSRPIGSTP